MGFGRPRYVGLSRTCSFFHLSRTGGSVMLRPKEHVLADSFISLSIRSQLAVAVPIRSVPYCGSRYAIPRGSRREDIIVGADDLTRYNTRAMDSRLVRPRSTKQQI
jgi:hypothetical protein